MRKLLAALVAVLFSSAVYAANLPILSGAAGGSTGCAEASQLVPCINQLIQSINTGVGGLINAQTAAVATGTGTSEQILQQFTLPTGVLTGAGQSVRISCWGTTGATANNKTVKLYYGTSVITSAAFAGNAQPWKLDLIVMYTGTATQAVTGTGLTSVAGTPTPISYTNQGTDNNTTGVLIKCTGTDGTSAAGDITANGMLTELIK